MSLYSATSCLKIHVMCPILRMIHEIIIKRRPELEVDKKGPNTDVDKGIIEQGNDSV